MKFRVAEQSILVSLLQEQKVKPVFLLGAGASKQSGVKLASEMVDEIAKHAYCKEHGYDSNDQRITASDWQRWVSAFPWYQNDYNALYPIIVDELLRPSRFKKEFFSKIIHPPVPSSKGYEIVAELMHLGLIDTILTTNFDDCLYRASVQVRMPPDFHRIKTHEDLVAMFSNVPSTPQLIYLHGSVEHYTDKNLAEEVQNLNKELIDTLKPILKDRPLVVIGYRGAEPSIMTDLLINNIQSTNNFHNGIYWCLLKRDFPNLDDINSLPPLVSTLATKTNKNFQFIQIDGFDELMKETIGKLKANKIDSNIDINFSFNSSNENQPVKINPTNSIGDIEIAFIRERVKNYCERLGIRVLEEESWLHSQMIRLRIALRTAENKLELTPSGILLFSSKTQQYVPNAYTLLKFIGSTEWLRSISGIHSEDETIDINYLNGIVERKISGNIWNQLNEITNTISLVNRPFRLKGEISENVYPYPTLALKEVIVNCLVHRDYNVAEPIVIEIHQNFIDFKNAGGLVEEVKRQLDDDNIENVIKKGVVGIKGYRNPVLADLFYGSGAMDKEGSGLSDVVRKVEDNSGKVTFGQPKNEQHFQVTIYSRMEEVNTETKTATSIKINEKAKFACNLLEVLKLPEKIYFAETSARTIKDVWTQFEKETRLPPYLLHGEKMWSFFDLSERKNPLSNVVDLGTVESLNVDEFVDLNNGTTELVRMLNDCIESHLSCIGLRVDRKKMRAYFPKNIDGTQKEIKYQGRMKKATRTVAKPRINPTSGRITYWEHKAIWFSFEKIGENWYLIINPTYVFTTDGYKMLLKSTRVSSLATKKASRDYNMHVHNDFTFWANYISGSSDGAFSLRFNKKNAEADDYQTETIVPSIIISAMLPNVEIDDVSVTEDFVEPDFLEDPDEIEDEIELIANQEIENMNDTKE